MRYACFVQKINIIVFLSRENTKKVKWKILECEKAKNEGKIMRHSAHISHMQHSFDFTGK